MHVWLGVMALMAAVPVVAKPMVVDMGQPLAATVNGRPVALRPSSCTVDHVKLNDEAVRRLRLVPRRPDAVADLSIGGARVLRGRHGPAHLQLGGRWDSQEVYWFEGVSALPEDGTVGPHGLPADVVELRLGGARADGWWRWPLAGSAYSCSHAVMALAETGAAQVFSMSIDMLAARDLPMVTASLGADLAATLGGRFEGPVEETEIVMGFKRPVRRMVLERPLMVGPWRMDAVLVRVGKQIDSTARLMEGQDLPRDERADPDEMVVTAKWAKRRGVARVLTLSRTQVAAADCAAMVVDKRRRRFELRC